MSAPLTPAGDLIVASWLNYRRHAAKYAEFAVFYCVLALLWWVVLVVTSNTSMSFALRTLTNLLLGAPIYFVGVVLTIGLCETIWNDLAGKTVPMRAAVNEGFRRVFPLIWVSVITTAAITAGTVLLVVPGIIIAVRWRFAQLEAMINGRNGLAATRESGRLTEGRFMEVCWRLVAPAVFFTVAGLFVTGLLRLLVGAVLGDPGLFFNQYDTSGGLPKSHDLLAMLIPVAVNMLMWPLYLGTEIQLWNELKRR